MNIRGFVLGVILLALVGWCMVQETVKQTQARYELAELTRVEEDSRKRLAILRTEEQELRSPARLAAAIREKGMSFVFLGSAMPQLLLMEEAMAGARRPGEVLEDADDALPRTAGREQVDMASADRW